jgi:hypothetical protein
MLTGQEQYYLERAGYFIRRQADLPERLVKSAYETAFSCLSGMTGEEMDLPLSYEMLPLFRLLGTPNVLITLRNILGADLRLSRVTILAAGDSDKGGLWHRDFAPSPMLSEGEQRAYLARFQNSLCLQMPFLLEEGMLVLPATHLEPVEQEDQQALQADPFAELPGQVRLRLQPGDVLFYNPNLFHRMDGQSERSRCVLTFTFPARVQPEAVPTTLLPVEAELLAELPPSLRLLLGLAPIL